MTYRELDEAANRVAHALAGHGASPGQTVALVMSRSAEAVVAMLAVLKAGAAYLPIDPVLPPARIRFMVEDAAPIAAITTAAFADRLDGHDLPVIDIDDQRVDNYPGSALPVPAPDDFAYLIYTSGTTGVPKGVATSHHHVIQLQEALGAYLPVAGVWNAVLLLCVRHVGVGDMGCPTARGTTGRGPRRGGPLPRGFPGLADRRTGRRAHPDPVGGEGALPRRIGIDRVGRGRRGLPGRGRGPLGARRVMINAYGPTETTMVVLLSEPLTARAGSVPIVRRRQGRRSSYSTRGCVPRRPGYPASCMLPAAE